MLLGPSIPQVISLFGISQSGGVFVPINDTLFPNQVAHIVTDCRMKGLIIGVAQLGKLREVIGAIPSLEFVIVVGDQELPNIQLSIYAFLDLCYLDPSNLRQEITIERDLAAILYISSSTGKPKRIMLSHANVSAGASIVLDYLGF